MRWLRHPFAADVLVADKLLALAFGAFGRRPMRGREQGLEHVAQPGAAPHRIRDAFFVKTEQMAETATIVMS